MPRFVALFRGINVGKAKRIAMADLRLLLTSMGYTDVVTLLNSGNAVFSSPVTSSPEHAAKLRTAVAQTLGVDAWVVVKSAKEMKAVVHGNPLKGGANDPSRLLVAVTNDAQTLTALEALAHSDWGDEELHVGTHAAYLWCTHGILHSKIAVALLKKLADTGTTRNWATVEKINTLLQADPKD